MVRHYHIIVNPKSGSSVELYKIMKLRNYLTQKGYRVHLDLTRSLAHAGQLAARAIEAGTTAILAAGGDGTIREVAEAMASSKIPICILPCGTENLLAQELGITGSLSKAIGTLEGGVIRDLDLGLANDHCFMTVVGVGFDGEVIRRINRFRAGHISHANYIWPICRTYWEYRFPHLRVEADGRLVCDEPALAFVGNISRYAIGLPIVPHADCGDGRLDLCIYKCSRRRQLLLHAIRTILHQSHRSRQVERYPCSNVTISSPNPYVPVQLDGDPGPSLPLSIKVIPAAAKVLTPPPPAGRPYCRPVRLYHLRRWLIG